MQSDNLQAFLIDQFLNTSKTLSLSDTNYVDFSVTSNAASKAANRFSVVFKQMAALPVTFTSVKALLQNDDVKVEWKVENERNIKQYEIEKSADGNLFTTMAVVLATANNGGSASYPQTDTHPLEGYNYYRIKSVDINGQIAYSNVVKVLHGNENKKIIVYPNPIQNGIINLLFENQPGGMYTIRILNKSGQLILVQQVQHLDGTAIEHIALRKFISQGLYLLEILKPDDTKMNIEFSVLE
jgi:hypothetical protein